MKKIILSFIALPLLVMTSLSFADKIILRGQPIVIQKQNGVYVPSTAVTNQDYYYFTIDNTRRVCYSTQQQTLDRENVSSQIYQVRLGNDVVNLYCYTYSADYFVVE